MGNIILAIVFLFIAILAVIGLAAVIFLVNIFCIKENDPYER